MFGEEDPQKLSRGLGSRVCILGTLRFQESLANKAVSCVTGQGPVSTPVFLMPLHTLLPTPAPKLPAVIHSFLPLQLSSLLYTLGLHLILVGLMPTNIDPNLNTTP
jgi:hypothetical protein